MWLAARVAGGALAGLLGLATVVVTAMLGHCSAFGGPCPSEGLEGDVIGGLAIGAALAVGGPLLAARPDRVGLLRAVIVSVAAAIVAALVGPAFLT